MSWFEIHDVSFEVWWPGVLALVGACLLVSVGSVLLVRLFKQ
jgi:hypothetical protein